MEGEQIIAKTKELKEILDGKNIEEDLLTFIKETNREQRENIQRCFDELYPETEGLNKIIEEKFKDNDQKFIKMLFDPRSTTGVQKIIDSFGIFSIDEDPVYELIFNYPKWLKDEIKKAGGNEVFFTGQIDENGVIISAEAGSRGNEHTVNVNFSMSREACVLIHNHPSGHLTPSEADLSVASYAAENAQGFYIVNNSVTNVYVVVEPIKPRKINKINEEEAGFYISNGGPLSKISSAFDSFSYLKFIFLFAISDFSLLMYSSLIFICSKSFCIFNSFCFRIVKFCFLICSFVILLISKMYPLYK